MSIIGFVPNPETAPFIVTWVRALANKGEETNYLCYERGFDGATAQAVREALGDEGGGGANLEAVDDAMPVAIVLEQVRKRDARLLVTGPFALPEVSGQVQTSDALVLASPCQTVAPIHGAKAPSEVKRILFVASGGAHDRSILRLVEAFRQRHKADVTIGGVEEETGAKAGHLGESMIRALLHDESVDEEAYKVKVVVDRLKHRGIIQLYDGHDLVIGGVDAASHLRPLQQSLGEAIVAIVKRSPPLRLSALAEWLPRINPADHAELMYSLRIGSRWGPDFVGMLGLASAIASLGLLQNSPAVVIGSMLLAPLMTPMIGLGLALGQANLRVARLSGRSIALGFLLTLGVSFLIGIITPSGETLSEEVLARGGPNVLDLLIAVFAAAAATFAMARPNIAGAIAGVAIATALVPPVCSIGISLANGELPNALGATVLFLTNLIAIIVMSSLTFSLLGITSARALPRYRRIAEGGRVALVVVLLLLAGPLSTDLLAQIQEGKNVALARPVTREVSRALHERVAQDKGVEIMLMARPRAERRVMIHIASHDELPLSYADELRKIVREKMEDPEIAVSVIAVRGLWRSDSDPAQDASR